MCTDSLAEAYRLHEREWESYESLREWFSWEIPSEFNIAAYVCDRWAQTDGERVALVERGSEGNSEEWTYTRLHREAGLLAAGLARAGVGTGDRVGVCLTQRPEAVVANVACWKLGAVSVPISTLTGQDALAHIVEDTGLVAAVVDQPTLFADVYERESKVETLIVLNGGDTSYRTYEGVLDSVNAPKQTVTTAHEDDALVLYTSGTTGPPKGVSHAHRFLLNNLPGFLTATCNLDLRDEDTFWTPAEWAWFASLFVVVLPALYYGKRVVAYDDGKFDPEMALTILEEHDVTQFIAPPTALRRMRSVDDRSHTCSHLRTITCGAHGEELATWVDNRFPSAVIHENYGQTESGVLAGECTRLYQTEPGCMGAPAPGYEVRLVDPESGTHEVDDGDTGEIATRVDDRPVAMKGYLTPDTDDDPVVDGWLLTGDLARQARDGTLRFESRKGEVIISAGHSIGPEEVEDALVDHDAVLEAGVIGIPHEDRGEVPKAYVRTAEGYKLSNDLVADLQDHVRNTLGKHKYPRAIEAINSVPVERGKVRRDELRDRHDASRAD